MADATEVNVFTAPEPCGRQHDNRGGDGHSQEDPGFIHRQTPVSDRANAEEPAYRQVAGYAHNTIALV